MQAEQESPDGRFYDEVVALTYNRSWGRFTGSARDTIAEPLISMGLESYWNGSAELNIDMSPPNSSVALRPFGFNAAYDGSATRLMVGGSPYSAGAAGVLLEGGNNMSGPLINVTDSRGNSATNDLLQMSRQDGSASMAWRAGGLPRLNFALQTSIDANSFGNFGVLKFAGEWENGEPVLEFESTGLDAMLATSYPVNGDAAPRFAMRADGLAQWGAGATAPDTDLYRSSAATLSTDGSLLVGGNLEVVGEKAALVKTESYGDRELYAVESPNQWFEDFGSARLNDGAAQVAIEPVFAQTVNTHHAYHVFLSPGGRCSLYVARKTAGYFEVKSMRGAGDCAFDYRVIAKRRGYENVRMAHGTPDKRNASEVRTASNQDQAALP